MMNNYKIVRMHDHAGEFSIEPDNQIDLGGKVLYLWQRENYMPDRDLIFEFEER